MRTNCTCGTWDRIHEPHCDVRCHEEWDDGDRPYSEEPRTVRVSDDPWAEALGRGVDEIPDETPF